MKVASVWSRGILFIALSFASLITASAQSSLPNTPRPVTLYYNGSWELTTPEKAVYKRQAMLDFENLLFNGISKDYAMDGKLIVDAFYEHGVNVGLHSEFFTNGKLESTFEYAEDGFIIWELNDENDVHQVFHGTGKFNIDYYYIVVKDNDIKLKEGYLAGEFTNGKRSGIWVYHDKDGTKTDEEIYATGLLQKRTSYEGGLATVQPDKKTIIISLSGLLAESFSVDTSVIPNLTQYFEKYVPENPPAFERFITFPGGLRKLLQMFASQITFATEDNLIAKLTVDEHGGGVKIKSTSLLIGWQINQELSAIIKKYEYKLLPAVKNGKAYTSTLKIPISNSPEWIDYLQHAADNDLLGYIDELNRE